jgi:hypothetical protein
VLKKPFLAVASAIGVTKHVTLKAMRRTFQDLARAAEVKDIVTRHLRARDRDDAAPLLDGRGRREEARNRQGDSSSPERAKRSPRALHPEVVRTVVCMAKTRART